MRIRTAAIAAAVLCLPLAACGSDSGKADAEPSKTSDTATAASPEPSLTQPVEPMAIVSSHLATASVWKRVP